jgi:shikimate kinase
MNIFLIGYRCSGKTTVGRSLAGRLERLFFDTDLELVKEQGMSISEIVSKRGWAGFREIEKQVIRYACERDQQVVATGGGAVLDEDNVKQMKGSGLIVWLRADIKTIEKRIIRDHTTRDFRPSLTSKGSVEEIKETLLLRNPYYEKTMDFLVDTDVMGIEDVCDEIIQKLKKFESKKKTNN